MISCNLFNISESSPQSSPIMNDFSNVIQWEKI